MKRDNLHPPEFRTFTDPRTGARFHFIAIDTASGAHESARQEGRRVRLPLEGDLESDALTREQQKKQFGVDPLDVEAMLSVSFPRP